MIIFFLIFQIVVLIQIANSFFLNQPSKMNNCIHLKASFCHSSPAYFINLVTNKWYDPSLKLNFFLHYLVHTYSLSWMGQESIQWSHDKQQGHTNSAYSVQSAVLNKIGINMINHHKCLSFIPKGKNCIPPQITNKNHHSHINKTFFHLQKFNKFELWPFLSPRNLNLN